MKLEAARAGQLPDPGRARTATCELSCTTTREIFGVYAHIGVDRLFARLRRSFHDRVSRQLRVTLSTTDAELRSRDGEADWFLSAACASRYGRAEAGP